jgi:alanyl-tRNA synthetase
MTELMYIEHPDLFESSAQVTQHGSDAKGVYLVFNQSLFYPQGGGQPADQGKIITANTCYEVFDVRNVDGEIRHYIIGNSTPIHPVDAVTIEIDKERRVLNSKYHTAGHLIAAVVEKENPELKAIKGHQFPGEAYVEFGGTVSDADNFMAQISSRVSECIASRTTVKTEELSSDDAAIIAQDLPYELPKNKSLRVCHIEGFFPVPCGGTHVNTLEDIASLIIKKCKNKKGKAKIYYEVE